MQYSEKEISSLIDEVTKEFTACFNKAEAEQVTLAKSEDGEKKEEPKKEESEHKPEHQAKESDKEEHKEPGHEEHHEDGEGHDYDQEDMEHMEKMYRSMSKGELKAHNDCIAKCMGGSSMVKGEIEQEQAPRKLPGAKSEASKGQEGINKAEHSSGGEIEKECIRKSPGAKSEASDTHGKEINKAEREIEPCPPGKLPGAKSEASDAHGKEINKSMEKSENTATDLLKSELEAKEAELSQLKKNFDAVQEFLAKLVKKTAPQGKAITSLDVIAKSEIISPAEKSLTKGEIHEVLKKKTSDPLLKSEDREVINKYYLSGQVNVNSISHLLK
jgi:hypothetical protein